MELKPGTCSCGKRKTIQNTGTKFQDTGTKLTKSDKIVYRSQCKTCTNKYLARHRYKQLTERELLALKDKYYSRIDLIDDVLLKRKEKS